MFKDTIAAIATANAKGALSIIRLSGEDSFNVVGMLTKQDYKNTLRNTLKHAWIYEGDEAVDEVVISFFKAPHSFTGEDVVEISCHGGIYITRKILSLILGKGVRLAKAGEFSQRAYLNNKMDLAQAEGINDLINAKNEVNAHSAASSLKGSVAKVLEPLEEDLTQIISHIEVNIDYPEYDDVEVLTKEKVLPAVERWIEEIEDLITKAKGASVIKEGIDTVILGKPNVGKSSLLNALLEENKAIVTEIAGTTRDLVEGVVYLGDIPLNLIDTAGIHKSEDIVEQIGIEKSLEALEKAELVIVVLDDSHPLEKEDEEILEKTENKNRIIVFNKTDVDSLHEGIHVSAKNNEIEELKEEITRKFAQELDYAKMDTLNNERQIGLARQASEAMHEAKKALEEGYELDLVTIDLQKCWNALKEITGKAYREELLDEIFSRFCLGK